MDEAEVAGELVQLAEQYEAKAKRLRDAAAVLVGGNVPPAAIQPTREAIERRLERNETDRSLAVPAETYIEVIADKPEFDWDAPTLAEAMFDRTSIKINKEAARTMLYRLEKRGSVVKSGRGTWRIAPEARSSGFAFMDLQRAPNQGAG